MAQINNSRFQSSSLRPCLSFPVCLNSSHCGIVQSDRGGNKVTFFVLSVSLCFDQLLDRQKSRSVTFPVNAFPFQEKLYLLSTVSASHGLIKAQELSQGKSLTCQLLLWNWQSKNAV